MCVGRAHIAQRAAQHAARCKAHQELVDMHAGVDGNLAAEVVLEFLRLGASRRMVRQQLGEPLPHAMAFVRRMPLGMLCT